MSAVLERPIRFQRVSSEAYKSTLPSHGITDAWAQGLVEMANQEEAGIYHAEPRTEQASTPTSFAEWCEEVLKPAVVGPAQSH